MLNEVVIAGKNYAVSDVERPDELDVIALKVIKQDCPPFIQPIHLMNIDGKIQVRHEFSGGICLSYIPMKMEKQELNRLLYQLLSPMPQCADWFLDYHHLCFDRSYIFVGQSDFKVRYIYQPERKQERTEEDILNFFRELIMDMEITDDMGYMTRLLKCTMQKGATIGMLMALVKENLQQGVGTQSVSQSQLQTQPMSQSTAQPAMSQSTVKLQIQSVSQSMSQPQTMPQRMSQLAQKSEAQPKQTLQNVTPPQNTAKKSEQPLTGLFADKEFGKSDLASLVGNGLFGDSVKPEKGKKEKPAKRERKEKAQTEKSGDLFGKLFGKEKKKDGAKGNAGFLQAEPVQINAAELQKTAPVQPMYQQPYVDQSQMAEYMDRTEIAEDDEVVQNDALTLCQDGEMMQQAPRRITLTFEKGYAVLGRYDKTGKACSDFNFDISLTYIGRRHMRIEKENEQYYLIDLESKNHTYLNGQELLPNHKYPLQKGDRIGITRKYNLVYRVC